MPHIGQFKLRHANAQIIADALLAAHIKPSVRQCVLLQMEAVFRGARELRVDLPVGAVNLLPVFFAPDGAPLPLRNVQPAFHGLACVLCKRITIAAGLGNVAGIARHLTELRIGRDRR